MKGSEVTENKIISVHGAEYLYYEVGKPTYADEDLIVEDIRLSGHNYTFVSIKLKGVDELIHIHLSNVICFRTSNEKLDI